MRPAHRLDGVPAAAAFVIDTVLVIVFAAIGRASHDEGIDPAGVLQTAWPFLVGLVVGWALNWVSTRRPPLSWRTAWRVWVLTVLVGMLVRRLTGDGTAVAFVIVATVTLGVLLLGWRLLAGSRLDPARR